MYNKRVMLIIFILASTLTTRFLYKWMFSNFSYRQIPVVNLPPAEFAKEFKLTEWEDFLNSSKHKLHSIHANDKELNIETSSINKIKQSVETLVQDIKKQVISNLEWESEKDVINSELRRLLGNANNILKIENNRTKEEIKKLQKRVQESLLRSQNPKNCQTSRRLICQLKVRCGVGCTVHQFGICLMQAFGTNRTMIVQMDKFYFFTDWENGFMSFSNTCSLTGTENIVDIEDPHSAEALVVSMATDKPHRVLSLFKPGTIPEAIAPELIRLHPDPPTWWIGQILSFICRPQQQIEKEINDFLKTHLFHEPIVGVHVRRTDKILENAYIELDHYMEVAEEWFLQYEATHNIDNVKRKIFLASDDVKVIEDAKRRYPNYEVIHNSESDTGFIRRWTEKGFRTAVVDIHLLSHCSFLVCTMSSNMCRLAYSLLQTHETEGYNAFYSLDDWYFYHSEWPRRRIAVESHNPNNREELLLSPGDIIAFSMNQGFWDGFHGYGYNLRTGHNGIFPSYKTKQLVPLAPYLNV